MSGSEKKISASWVDDVASIIDAVTNLYNAVAAKSPRVADTVVILAALLPFYICYVWGGRLRQAEKNTDAKVKSVGKAKRKSDKAKLGGKKP